MFQSPMNSTLPPISSTTTRHSSDYVQLVVFSILLLIGLPVNVSTLVYMLRRYRHAKSFLLLLHINLNVSDILVLGVHVPGMMGWLVSQQWLAGDVICRIMRFGDGFVWAVSSNIMVCIAVYRLFALRYPSRLRAAGHQGVPRMLVSAWGMAAITMTPQLFVWRQVELPDMTQCMSIWTAKMTMEKNEGDLMTPDDFTWMKLYNLQSVFIVFYIPLIILVFCYVLILKDIYATLNNEAECSSALYMSEISKLSTCGKRNNKNDKNDNNQQNNNGRKEKESFVSVKTATVRGQDKFRRAKVRSLRITLLLILAYVITWLPLNLLAWRA